MNDFDPDFPLNMEVLLSDAVEQILSHEDPQQFRRWMQDNIAAYYALPEMQPHNLFDRRVIDPDPMSIEPDMLKKLASNLAIMIWNGMPLPSNHFKPRPIALPKRNDFCHCGSGKKYKQCCANLPFLHVFSSEEIWPLIFDKLDSKTAARAIRESHVPVSTLGMLAVDFLDSGQPGKAVAMLAPLFEGKFRKTNDDAEFAMTMLCDAYDELGNKKKKVDLLQSILDSAPKSPLRSGAWQRLATIRIDSGDLKGAWQAFQSALHDDPHSLSLGLLEVQILYAQGEVEKAKQRADFWVRKLRRAEFPDEEMPLKFLIDVAINPVEAFADFEMEMVDDAGQLLRQWLESVQHRALPQYSISDEEEPLDPHDEDGMHAMRDRLVAHGLDEDTVEAAIQSMQGQLDALPQDEEDATDESNYFRLLAPGEIQALEMQWHRVFPFPKPFATHELPFGDDDPWEVQAELDWASWLMDNPMAFDSVDILDDLATALLLHPQFGSGWLYDLLLIPILQRSEGILDKAMAIAGVSELPWIIADNRSALRALSRQINIAMMNGDPDEVLQRALKLLAINPHDNHGVRILIMNELIYAGRDEAAVELAEQFPGDIHAEVTYGKILALYRLGRKKEAVQEVGEALGFLDKIPRYLIAKRIKKPDLKEQGIMYGGDDQAWYYRQAMRDEWLQTPGALEWLKSTEKAFS